MLMLAAGLTCSFCVCTLAEARVVPPGGLRFQHGEQTTSVFACATPATPADSGPDSTLIVDATASFQGPRGTGVVFGGHGSDAVAQMFTVSRDGRLAGIDLHVVSYPPGSPPREFRWLLRDAADLDPDAPDIQALPVLTSGTASSVEAASTYVAPPCRVRLRDAVEVRQHQALLLEAQPLTDAAIVWNGGFGDAPGAAYWCRDGSWSRVRGRKTLQLGRVVWLR